MWRWPPPQRLLGLGCGQPDQTTITGRRRHGASWLTGLLLSAILLLLGSMICLPGSSTGGMIVFWAILAGEERLGMATIPWRAAGDCPNFRVNEKGTVPFDATRQTSRRRH